MMRGRRCNAKQAEAHRGKTLKERSRAKQKKHSSVPGVGAKSDHEAKEGAGERMCLPPREGEEGPELVDDGGADAHGPTRHQPRRYALHDHKDASIRL